MAAVPPPLYSLLHPIQEHRTCGPELAHAGVHQGEPSLPSLPGAQGGGVLHPLLPQA